MLREVKRLFAKNGKKVMICNFLQPLPAIPHKHFVYQLVLQSNASKYYAPTAQSHFSIWSAFYQ